MPGPFRESKKQELPKVSSQFLVLSSLALVSRAGCVNLRRPGDLWAENRRQAEATFVPSVVAGSATTVPWCGGWSAICRSCSRFMASPPTPLEETAHHQRCFVEVRRRTRPMVCFVSVASVDRIIYSIF